MLISYLHEHADAEETRRWVEEAGRKAVLVPGDVAYPAHCRALVARTVEEFGRIDVLVNNEAFQMFPETLEGIPDQEWDHALATNLGAFFHFVKPCPTCGRTRRSSAALGELRQPARCCCPTT
ncbi:SDR family oxidoreductase [Amycolatopsis carbonis]|uniref:SDR family oxidoreductase n=1 Tax=Amycolatopsis carbonis TaxID=715471 RepID=A0A9Y2IM46_9PSEU|nr:SDR family oxidoreductase [Amycolatopsis sp. 2-15]WIX82865.1 SDR family oxidoreductase [Amycolatopsis sp. 2-15]